VPVEINRDGSRETHLPLISEKPEATQGLSQQQTEEIISPQSRVKNTRLCSMINKAIMVVLVGQFKKLF